MKEKIKKFFEKNSVLVEAFAGVLLLLGTGKVTYNTGRKHGMKEQQLKDASRDAADAILGTLSAYTEGYSKGYKEGFVGKEEKHEG